LAPVQEEAAVQVEELAQERGLVSGLEELAMVLAMVLALALEVLDCRNRHCSGRR